MDRDEDVWPIALVAVPSVVVAFVTSVAEAQPLGHEMAQWFEFLWLDLEDDVRAPGIAEFDIDSLRFSLGDGVDVSISMLTLESSCIPLRRAHPPTAILTRQGRSRPAGIEPAASLDKWLVTSVVGCGKDIIA